MKNHRTSRKKIKNQIIRHIFAGILLTAILIMIGNSRSAHADSLDHDHDNVYKGAQKYFTSYMVEPGDTMEKIALKFASGQYGNQARYIDEVRSINGMIDRNLSLKAGSYIIVPYWA